jgi:hypothetical protein
MQVAVGSAGASEHIKEEDGSVMTAAQVETQVENMFASLCGFCEKDPFTVRPVLTAALRESVISHDEAAGQVYDSEAQLKVMEQMREIVLRNAGTEEILNFDAEVDSAGRGPLYFNLVVMLYKTWSEKYKSYLDEAGSYVTSDDSGEYVEGGSDDELARMLPASRKTGVVSVLKDPTDMHALLSGLRDVYP